jgi:hypothetical protein
MADGQSSPGLPTVELLGRLAARQGVIVSDEDLEAVRSFLDTILPELARLEAALAPGEAP